VFNKGFSQFGKYLVIRQVFVIYFCVQLGIFSIWQVLGY
jgi:hypothetical protein